MTYVHAKNINMFIVQRVFLHNNNSFKINLIFSESTNPVESLPSSEKFKQTQ